MPTPRACSRPTSAGAWTAACVCAGVSSRSSQGEGAGPAAYAGGARETSPARTTEGRIRRMEALLTSAVGRARPRSGSQHDLFTPGKADGRVIAAVSAPGTDYQQATCSTVRTDGAQSAGAVPTVRLLRVRHPRRLRWGASAPGTAGGGTRAPGRHQPGGNGRWRVRPRGKRVRASRAGGTPSRGGATRTSRGSHCDDQTQGTSRRLPSGNTLCQSSREYGIGLQSTSQARGERSLGGFCGQINVSIPAWISAGPRRTGIRPAASVTVPAPRTSGARRRPRLPDPGGGAASGRGPDDSADLDDGAGAAGARRFGMIPVHGSRRPAREESSPESDFPGRERFPPSSRPE